MKKKVLKTIKENDGLTYEIGYDDQHHIKCLICNMKSYNVEDIDQKYCGKCHQFHDILYWQVQSLKI